MDPLGNPIFSVDPSEDYDSAQTGVVDTNGLVDNLRSRVQQFQGVLNALDVTHRELYESGMYAYASGDESLIAEYESLESDFQSKLTQIRTVQEGINLAASAANSVGVNLPQVQMPMGLGVFPLIPAATVAATLAAAGAIIYWGALWIKAVAEYASRAQHLDAIMTLPEAERASALEAFRKTENATKISLANLEQSPLTAVANLAKYAAVAAVAFLAWKAWKESR